MASLFMLFNMGTQDRGHNTSVGQSLFPPRSNPVQKGGLTAVHPVLEPEAHLDVVNPRPGSGRPTRFSEVSEMNPPQFRVAMDQKPNRTPSEHLNPH